MIQPNLSYARQLWNIDGKDSNIGGKTPEINHE